MTMVVMIRTNTDETAAAIGTGFVIPPRTGEEGLGLCVWGEEETGDESTVIVVDSIANVEPVKENL